jgi:GNAT superfamily N-acetyltransferase
LSEQVFTATSDADYLSFAGLVSEYVQWCRVRYASNPWFVEEVFGYQSLEAELKTLARSYGPPNGTTLLARRGEVICGGGAFRRFSADRCEMKRLFVPQRFAGQGTGRLLCRELMHTAAREGYTHMLLDTANLLKEAIGLYHSMGFRECAPYRSYPAALMPFLVFMEAKLPSPEQLATAQTLAASGRG